MLNGLKIDNIAVIEKAAIEFRSGLNILTGETGAGKSIVIDSINAILGERTSRELIREGNESAKVFAQFTDIPKGVEELLDRYDIEKSEDGSLTVSRTIALSGKNSCRVNGYPVTVSQIKEIGSALINIHGQHDSQALLSPEKHYHFIDLMAGNSAILTAYRDSFSNLLRIKHELDALYDRRDEAASRLEYLDFVIKEIEDAALSVGESDALSSEKNLIENSVKVQKLLGRAYNALSCDGGLREGIVKCAEDLEAAAEYYTQAKKTAENIRNTAFEIDEFTSAVSALLDSFSFSPERLTEINDRLDMIYRLSMKYGKDEKEILEFCEKSKSERELISSSDDRIKKLEEELYRYSDEVKSFAEKLTESRKSAALAFEKEVTERLVFLDMPHAVFKVDIKETPLSVRGAETMDFLISTNPGQPPKPLSKIASGGELSRIMLAIKDALTDRDDIPTLIFDEIDSGVSGSAAEKIALKLHSVSRGRQVICVTHLARIAAQADYHLKIIKEVENGGTYTKVIPLDDEGRAEEIARITAGTGVTGLQIESAKEILSQARKEK